MSSRYINRHTVQNSQFSYREIMNSRDKTTIVHYRSPDFNLPDREVMQSELNFELHEWKVGDRYWKLASVYYGDPSFWWVIAYYNSAPTENHVACGEVLQIPMPLDKAVIFTGQY